MTLSHAHRMDYLRRLRDLAFMAADPATTLDDMRRGVEAIRADMERDNEAALLIAAASAGHVKWIPARERAS